MAFDAGEPGTRATPAGPPDWSRYGVRAPTFKRALQHVASRIAPGGSPTIVETGTTRREDAYTDGQSTVLFDWFASCYPRGRVVSVDIELANCEVARTLVSDRTRVACADSVQFLASMPASLVHDIDLLYLDSFDLDWNNPHPSSLHHLMELTAVYRSLHPGCVVVVDDNASGVGKGAYVKRFFESLGIAPLFDAYQLAFVVP